MTQRGVSRPAAALAVVAALAAGAGSVSLRADATPSSNAASGLRPLLAYSSYQGRLDSTGLTPNKLPDLYLITPDGRRAGRVTRTLAYESFPVWSPDGRWVAYERGDDLAFHAGSVQGPGPTSIWISRPDGTGARRLTGNAGNRDDPPFDEHLAWSPDGKTIAFHRANIDGTIPAGIYIVRVDGGGVRRLAPSRGVPLRWSPDGRTLATTDGVRIRLIDVATGRPVRRWPVSASEYRGSLDVHFAADGGVVVLGGDRTGVFVLDLRDGRRRRIVRARGVSTVSWSSDGQSIAFAADGPRDADVFVVGADGRGLRRLTDAGHDGQASWRP